MDDSLNHVEYDKWEQVVTGAQLIIACLVCTIEAVDNALLYFTRSQGYGPDTIVEKLLRYFVLTSIINFSLVIISRIAVHRSKNKDMKKYLLMTCTTLICANVAFSHYQFATALLTFVIPIVISILYEDQHLSTYTFAMSIAGEALAVAARAFDNEYSKDIAPEAVIAFSFIVATYILAKMINNTLLKRRWLLGQAISENERSNAAAEKMIFSMKMLETLAGTIDAKDKYTDGHSKRVAAYATMLAETMGWDEKRVSMLRYEALLHDVGKIGVPDAVLNKPAKLTETEFDIIRSHTLVGADILKNMVAVPGAYEVAKYHHERFDGKGYPSGLSGEEIPVDARVICIADSYDAMSSDRIYRKALSEDVIRQELVKGKGTQFDPDMLNVFLRLFDEKKFVASPGSSAALKDTSGEQHVIDDIEKVLWRMTSIDESKSAVYDFEKFYAYMKNIALRYNRSIEVLSITLTAEASDGTGQQEEAASDYLQIAIKKNIRSVDVYYRYSALKHMVILLDAGVDNIDMIRDRIRFDYESNEISHSYELSFELRESIGKKDPQ